ncbi:MAG: quinone oxidoreductase [Lysobacterales bacterium]
MHALVFDGFGGPDVLRSAEVPDPVPAEDAALVRTHAIGLNFADVYRRQGRYHLVGAPPFIAGYEAAGVVEQAPTDSGFCIGDRVAFADVPLANAELVGVPVDRLIPLPDDISFETAAALLLQGLTAQYLIRDSHPLRAGEAVLVHAAAGGVGQLLVQLCVAAGARVLALVSTAEKCAVARAAGAEECATYAEDWVAAAHAFAPGGVDAVFDSVGTTLDDSLNAVRIGGRVVFYGMAGGSPKPVAPSVLMDGSKTLTGGDLWNVLLTAQDRRERASELFARVRDGSLEVHIDSRFALGDGAAAHRHLESRRALGKVLLIP